ncbi:TIGR03032 family protein [Vibrio albus]|uniref:TIGR03032 family protein n=1 Tax=Vibrio albus TaxID=2200953 RepID=A0A2U3B9B5_9VIBR|nr:TIGR03032 family protein [Vibrio albus]PWI33304.1 TIGR03032 family protein [Vibrio albus]
MNDNFNNAPQEEGRSNNAQHEKMDLGCQYSENLPAILKQLNVSLALTSYQVGKLILVRSDGQQLDVNYKSFPRPMGLAVHDGGLTLGIFTQIINFQREDGLLEKIKQPLDRIEQDITAPKVKPTDDQLDEEQRKQQDALYEPVDDRTDACFIARSAHHSGMINIHDIEWGNAGLWAVNSSFSCLCTLEPDYSFVPRWKPHFISELVPEDRCHLNGMTLKDGKPAYVTTFSQEDTAAQWREKTGKFNGTLMDVQSNTILVDGLSMPHSPRWYRDRVYFCNSGQGELCSYEPQSNKTEVLAELPGFTRGMDFYGPIVFVGLSKVRESNVKRPAPLTEKYPETMAGVRVINLEDNSEIGFIQFTGDVAQIYDVALIPNTSFPELIEPDHPRMRNHFSHPTLQPLNES